MDIIIVLGVAYYIAFYVSKRFTIEKREILICLIIIMALVHIVNSAIFYFQTVEWLHEEKEEKTGAYEYFSLEFTKPYSEEREKCYKYTMMVHSLFMHIVPGMTIIYCMVG